MIEHQNPALNAVSAGGQAIDPGSGVPESGMPAGGPDDLALRAADTAEERAHEPADPFGAGIDARANGQSVADCPFPANSDQAASWIEGFHHRDGVTASV